MRDELEKILRDFLDDVDWVLENPDTAPVHDKEYFDRPITEALTSIINLVDKELGDRKTVKELFPDADIHDFTKEEWCKNAVLVAKKDMYNQAREDMRASIRKAGDE